MDLWRFCLARPGPGRSRAAQRGFLHGGATDQRVWDPYGDGSTTRRLAANRVQVGVGKRGRRNLCRSRPFAGPQPDHREVGTRESPRSGHSPGRNDSPGLGVWVGLRNTGAPRLQGRSGDCATLRVRSRVPTHSRCLRISGPRLSGSVRRLQRGPNPGAGTEPGAGKLSGVPAGDQTIEKFGFGRGRSHPLIRKERE